MLKTDPEGIDTSYYCFDLQYTLTELSPSTGLKLAEQGVTGVVLDLSVDPPLVKLPQLSQDIASAVYSFKIEVTTAYDLSLLASYTLKVQVDDQCSAAAGLEIV